jgi:hypothetical protein
MIMNYDGEISEHGAREGFEERYPAGLSKKMASGIYAIFPAFPL